MSTSARPHFTFNLTKRALEKDPPGQQTVYLDERPAFYVNLNQPRWAEIRHYTTHSFDEHTPAKPVSNERREALYAVQSLVSDAAIKTGDKDEILDVIDRALASTPAVPQEAAWKPIETAPKDGRFILASRLGVGVPSIIRWECRRSLWRNEWVGYSGNRFVVKVAQQPTHWMPLPYPPPRRTITSRRRPQPDPITEPGPCLHVKHTG